MKNVGFYGNSDCVDRGADSYLDLFADRLNLNVVNTGVKQGSEERVLYELKKTRDLDLAVIIHCPPQYLFLPGCDRDIGLNHLREHRAAYLFANWETDPFKENSAQFLEKFSNPANLIGAIQCYKDYFYNPDLQMNRFTGALIQIDQYCSAKNIPVIHITNKSIPDWFKFNSGVVDTVIGDIIVQHATDTHTRGFNGLTKQGNQLVCDRLTELVESLTPSPGVVA